MGSSIFSAMIRLNCAITASRQQKKNRENVSVDSDSAHHYYPSILFYFLNLIVSKRINKISSFKNLQQYIIARQP